MSYIVESHTISTEKIKVISAGICSIILTAGFARFAYTPLLPVMHQQAGLSTLMGGWLATFNYLGYMTGVLLVSFSNSLRFKYQLYRAGLIAAVITTLAMGFTQNPIIWSILRFISGISSTAGILLSAGFVLNWLRNRHYRAELRTHYTGIGIGIGLSGLGCLLMQDHFNWAFQWQFFGAVGILFFLPAWFWMPRPESALSSDASKVQPAPTNTWMVLMIAAYFCAGFGYVISATFIVDILEKIPLLTGKGAIVWILLGIAATPGAYLWDRVNRKTGDLNALLLCFLFHLISIVIPAAVDGPSANLIAAMLFGNTFTGIVSLTLSIVGRAFPSNPAKAMARLTMSYGVSQITGPAIAGYLSVHSGSYRSALWLSVAVVIVGICLIYLLKRIEEAK